MSRPEASGSEPANTSTISGPDTATERPLLVEFAELWNRGLADERKLWELFDVSEMYLYKPDYFGAQIFEARGQLFSPVFSSLELLTEFVHSTPFGPDGGHDGFSWVRIRGAAFLGLPVRARLLVIDPGQEHAVTVDLASRADAPPLTGELPPVAIHVHVTADGAIKTGLPDDINDDLRKSEDGR